MASCTFFGHKDSPREIETMILSTLIDLIENRQVDTFYVGNNGNYDAMVIKKLKVLMQIYPQLQCTVVLAYLPKNDGEESFYRGLDTLYPEECGKAPRKFAIDRRNHWMLARSEYVVTYVERDGGAFKFKNIALKAGKNVVELSEE